MIGVHLDSPRGDLQSYPSSGSSSGKLRSVADTLKAMLSINFSTPLTGKARDERIKQMTSNHSAFQHSRYIQGSLVKIQTSLLRMPGVSAAESKEICEELKNIGVSVCKETGQLVDALMNVVLDHEETEKSLSRMSIEINLAKARCDDLNQIVRDMEGDYAKEKKKRLNAEEELAKVMKELQDLRRACKTKSQKSGSNASSSVGRDEIVKRLEETIKHLDEQVNNRRSLWVMKHADAQSVARAIETIVESCPDRDTAQQTIKSLQTMHEAEQEQKASRGLNVMSRPYHPYHAGSPAQYRSPTVGPPKMGSLHPPPPPRASSTAPNELGQTTTWGRNSPSDFHHGQKQGNGQFYNSGIARGPSRRGHRNSSGGYRPTAPEFQPSAHNMGKDLSRPMSSFGYRRGYNPSTPSGMRNEFGQSQELISPDYNKSYTNGALTRNIPIMPLVTMTEYTVKAWNAQITQLYAAIRSFVERHAGNPTAIRPMELKKSKLWPILLAIYHPLSEHEAASYLDFHLKEASAKACLVTRVIIDYVVNRVWVPRAWVGSTRESSQNLLDIERELEAMMRQPASTRQPLLDRQSIVVDSIMKREQHSGFARRKTEEIIEALLDTIKPLFNEGAVADDAYEDLDPVAEAAWNLSSRILTSRLTFDFRFPEVGSRFSCQSMVPVWPDLDPMEIQAKHWRVALVTTPVITCRNDTGTNISAHSVSLADVICMQ